MASSGAVDRRKGRVEGGVETDWCSDYTLRHRSRAGSQKGSLAIFAKTKGLYIVSWGSKWICWERVGKNGWAAMVRRGRGWIDGRVGKVTGETGGGQVERGYRLDKESGSQLVC